VTLLLLSAGALVGAPARYLTDRRMQRRFGGEFPWGTLVVNVLASLLLGALIGAGRATDPRVLTVVGTGFCGALSTYSTFSFETMRLYEVGSRARSISYLAVTLVVGLAAAAAGWAIGSGLS
jgi:CrcB protein